MNRWAVLVVTLAVVSRPAVAVTPVTPVTALDAPAQIDAALASTSLDEAAELIARNAATLPPTRLQLAQADYALARGDVEAALAAYAAIASDPAVAARAQLGIGLAQLRLDHDALAIVALDAATAGDPGLVRAWTARGVAADRARDWTGADDAYGRALALDPRAAAALANRGYSKLLRGRLSEAADDSARALAIDPKLAPAANNLRLARAMQGDYKIAFAGSTKASLANDLNTVGFAAMSRGDYGTAETFFTRAMHISPQFDHTAWDNLVYLKQLSHQPTVAGAGPR